MISASEQFSGNIPLRKEILKQHCKYGAIVAVATSRKQTEMSSGPTVFFRSRERKTYFCSAG